MRVALEMAAVWIPWGVDFRVGPLTWF
jgi:hypothetical protein